MVKAAVLASGLGIKKSGQEILKDLSFTIGSGVVIGLIGPSGSGKTTLMRTIIGVQAITNGELTVLDIPAGSKTLRSKIGYVTQSPAVYYDLTVRQNLNYFAKLVGAKKVQIDEVIKHVHLEDQHQQLTGSLSGGQLARVSLAVALLGEPELLVLDEPTVGLDPVLRNQLWDLFMELAATGKTLIISSHVMDEAERCDTLLLLRDGQLLWNDTKEKLLKETAQKTVGDAFVAMIQKGGE